MQIVNAVTGFHSLIARLLRAMLIGGALLLIACSVITSLSRPGPRHFTPDEAAVESNGDAVTGAEGAAASTSSAPEQTSAAALIWRAATSSWWISSAIPAAELEQAGPLTNLISLNATPGKTYTLRLEYGDCGQPSVRAFESLDSARPEAAAGLLDAPGPGRKRPDATALVPSAYAAPGSTAPHFSLWGGVFGGAVHTAGDVVCSEASAVELPVRAHAETLVLVFSAYASQSPGTGDGIAPIMAYLTDTL
jgi:hypothetical protein